jgi:DNA ligase-1
MNTETCNKWLENKTINPITKRKIKVDGPTYKKIEKECNKIFQGKKSPVTELAPAKGVVEKRKVLKERKKKEQERKALAKKMKKEKIKALIQEREERLKRKMDTPEREGNTRKTLRRLNEFIEEMNSTNNKQKVLMRYKDLSGLVKYIYDEETDFGIDSDDYETFLIKKKTKLKKIKHPYTDLLELLQDLDDYKKDKAVSHLKAFIDNFSEYKDLILNIIDKDLPIKKGPITSIKKSIKKDDKEEKKEMENTEEILTELERMIYELQKTNKRNQKVEILKKYKHISKILKFIFDPDINYGITSKRYQKYIDNDKKQKRELIDKYTNIYEFLQALDERKLTGETALLHLYNFIDTYKVHKSTILSIIDKNIKTGVHVKLILEIFPKLFTQLNPVLAHKFDEEIIKKNPRQDWYISRKFDGVRCLTIINPTQKKIKFLSRTGKPILTLGNLEKSLMKHIHEYNETIVLDGEIIAGSEKKEDFKQIMEQIRKKNFTIENPEYRVFDIISGKTFMNQQKGMIFSKRQDRLLELFGKGRVEHIRALKQFLYVKEAFEKLKKMSEKKGWEGLMIRKDTYYKSGRTKDLLKYKSFLDEEFKVIGIETGEKGILNKQTGLVDEVPVMSAIIINYNNTTVGSGFSDKERLEFYKNPDKIVGKIVTIKYFEKTEKSLRFPIFKGIQGESRVY